MNSTTKNNRCENNTLVSSLLLDAMKKRKDAILKDKNSALEYLHHIGAIDNNGKVKVTPL